MASSSTPVLPQISLSFLLFVFLSSPFSSAASNDLPLSSSTSNGSLSVPPPGKIVEKKFRFPYLDAASGPSIQDFGHHAGYCGLPHSFGEKIFYMFFESRNSKKDPVVIWFAGGPGCGGEQALFYEHGPFKITQDLSLVWNDYGWDKVSNIVYIDQPIGAGFSNAYDENDIPHDEEGVSNDMFDFLQVFFKEHSEFVDNDFYMIGKSYAGHFIPAIASRIHQANKADEGIHINLKGFAIGNGLTNPEIQYPAYTDFALDNGLINRTDYNRINEMLPQCLQLIRDCGNKGGDACEAAFSACHDGGVFQQTLVTAGNINFYDIRIKNCHHVPARCYNFSSMGTFLNKKEVREALGVGDLEYDSCNDIVFAAMKKDWMKNLELGIPALLENGIRMLVYAGEKDFICNWLGNERWVNAMKWSGQEAFLAAPNVSFVVDGREAGTVRSHGPLTLLKIHEAGHFVAMDQPVAALEMLTTWMQGKISAFKETAGGTNV